MFTRIAEAEAQVHGVSPGEVTFHEVGALDSIIDIVGAAICLDMLRPDRITSTEIELGGGTIRCAHGILPVPAPATLLLVKGLPVKTGGFNKEMTTPTGAAILAASVDEFIPAGKPSGVFTELGAGYGLGTRRMGHFTGLRVSWRQQGGTGEIPWESETLTLLEANIDDMTGEALGFLMERLFEAGALDVSYGPLTMKKSRPGTLVSVLGRTEQLGPLGECLFRHSTTIGFRELRVNRFFLNRDEAPLKGPYGEVRQKRVYLGDRTRTKIEYEDRARLAREKNISLNEAEGLLKGGPET
jgi:uncharacterized protein (TIGR00299 family) protein